MDSRTRLLTAWSFREPDRVPIEIELAEPAYVFPEAHKIADFVEHEADNMMGAPGADWGFCGLRSAYQEEVIEDVPGDHYRMRRVHLTSAGEFHAITLHKYNTLTPNDFYWERHYVHTVEEMERLAQAKREAIPLQPDAFRAAVEKIGGRGLPLVGLLHPLGWLVRNANLTEVYGWFLTERATLEIFLERSSQQVAETIAAMGAAGIGPHFSAAAHEMLTPPWMGHRQFDQFVFPYDKLMNDAIHRIGGKLRIHSHGNCMTFLEKFSDMGVDAIEPLEHPPFGDVDLAKAKRLVGDRMMLSGNVASQNFLYMSREEVRQEVKSAIQAAAPGGGFSLRPAAGSAGTNSVQDADQMRKYLDNIEAFIEAGIEFGSYPIKTASWRMPSPQQQVAHATPVCVTK